MAKRKNGALKSPFSERLKYLRKQKGINMEQLAQKVEVSKSYISLLESGGRQPSREVVLKLAQALFGSDHGPRQDELLVLAGFAPQEALATAPKDLVDVYQQNLAINPEDFKLYTYMIVALIKSGRFEEAQEQIQRGLQIFSESVQLQCLLSNLELSRQNYEAAILNQKTAIETFRLQKASNGLKLKMSDLLFNLGEIYFMQGYQFLGQSYQESHDQSEAKAIEALQQAGALFKQALEESAENVYILDECARLFFNLAFLNQGSQARNYWQLTLDYFTRVFSSAKKHWLGEATLAESACFMAHAYAKSGRFHEAEITLGLVDCFQRDYWLVHYIDACLNCLKFEATPEQAHLDHALRSLKQAMSYDVDENRTAFEAVNDPDLKALRTHRKQDFNTTIKGEI